MKLKQERYIVNKYSDLIKWASENATYYISPLGNRWLHVQGVVEQALRVGAIFDESMQSWHLVVYQLSLSNTAFSSYPNKGGSRNTPFEDYSISVVFS